MGYPFVNPYLSQLQMQPQMQPQIQPQMQPATYTNGKVWVSGEAGAKAYLVAPNSDVTLWDSEAKKIYIKSADANGMPSMKVLNYTIEGEDDIETNIVENVEYATKADVENEIARLEKKIDSIKNKTSNGELAQKKNVRHSN